MRSSLLSLALLHAAAMLAVAWRYFGDAALSANQESFERAVLALGGCLMLLGALVTYRTPALASVPFGLAGLLVLSTLPVDDRYLTVYGGWSLALAVLAITASRWPQPHRAPVRRRTDRGEATVVEEPIGASASARHVVRRVRRHRARPRHASAGRGVAVSPAPATLVDSITIADEPGRDRSPAAASVVAFGPPR